MRTTTPIQAWAHQFIKYALSSGKLQRGPCEACGAEKAQAHHDDYLRPNDVRWLCVRCHRAWHREHGVAANADAPIPYTKHAAGIGAEMSRRGEKVERSP